VYGQSGAPLEDAEVDILKKIFPQIKPYMTSEGIDVVERTGVFDTDFDNDKVTPLVGNSEDCVYCFKKNGVANCAIEKAFVKGEINFRKPLSCHLYPIRITKYKDFDAVICHNWDICNVALILGKRKQIPLYIFLKEPLIRKYGEKWYEQLCEAANLYKKSIVENKTKPTNEN